MSDLSMQWLIVFVDASAKAALVALVAATGLALLRVRDSNLRHRVWTGVLCGMLLLPALTQVVPALRLPFTVDPAWFAILNRTDGEGPENNGDRPDPEKAIATTENVSDDPPAPFERESTTGEGRTLAGQSDWPDAPCRWPGEFAGSPPQPLSAPDTAPPDDPPNPPATAAATVPIEPGPPANELQPTAVSQSIFAVILSHLPVVFWSLWICGGAILALRLLAGLWMARVLRRASRPIAQDELQAVMINSDHKGAGGLICGAGVPPAGAQAGRLHHNTCEPQGTQQHHVPIAECPVIRVPLTLGVVRPQILLPPDWIDWSTEKLHAVLAHERTHAERGDCAMAFLAEVNRCLYWFHPLAWWLRRRLASLAEAACDDAAIGSIGDRASYARHLLEVAATARTHRGRLIAGSVSMARRSNVETRINAILDFTRPLSQRLTRGMAIVLVGVIVPLVALAAALRPSTGQVEESLPISVAIDENLPSASEENPTDAPAEKPSPENSSLSTEYSVLSTQSPALESDSGNNPRTVHDAAFTVAGTVVDEQDQPVAGAVPGAGDAAPPAARSRTIRGRVVDAAGKPIAGVALSVPLTTGIRFDLYQWKLDRRATTDAEGRFSADVSEGDFPLGLRTLPLLALHSEYAVEWFDVPEQGEIPQAEIVLNPDQVIQGRMIDTEGRPVVGAMVAVRSLQAPKSGNSLDPMLDQIKNRPAIGMDARKLPAGVLPNSFGATSDDQGRFVLRGVAAERICEIDISAPRFATTALVVANRQGLDATAFNQPGPRRMAFNLLNRPHLVGPEFTHVGAPDLTIEGRATTTDGKPIADLDVFATMLGSPFPPAVTDADGRYRLSGLPRGRQMGISFAFGGHGDLLPQMVRVSPKADEALKTVDVEMKRGIFVSGRVIDASTGAGVFGNISFVPLPGNANVPKPTNEGPDERGTTGYADKEGNFRFVVIPGPGVLLFGASPALDSEGRRYSIYPQATISEEDASHIKLLKVDNSSDRSFFLSASGQPTLFEQANAVKYVNFAEDGGPQTVNFKLDRGRTVELEFVDSDGQVVTGVAVSGTSPPQAQAPAKAIRVNESRTTIFAIGAGQPRKIVAVHEARGLAGTVTLTGDEGALVRLTLEKSAAIRGRAVDESGIPLTAAEFSINFDSPAMAPLQRFLNSGNGGPATDNDGRFRIANLVPGEGFNLSMRLEGRFLIAKLTKEQQTLEPGQDLDLGDVVFVPRNRQLPEQNEAGKPPAATPPLDPPADGGKKTSSAVDAGKVDAPNATKAERNVPLSTEYPVLSAQSPASDDTTLTYRGRVVDPDGKPFGGARVCVIGWYGGFISGVKNVPASQTKSQADGSFEIKFNPADLERAAWGLSLSDSMTTIAAFGDGFGPVWKRLEELAPGQGLTLQLARDDVPVTGRILDPEGRPVNGVKIAVHRVRAPKQGDLAGFLKAVASGLPRVDAIDEWMTYLPDFDGIPVPTAVSDAQGRFRLAGIGRERYAEFTIVGPNAAYGEGSVVTRTAAPTVMQETDSRAPIAAKVARRLFGADIDFVALPSRPVTGIVRDGETGKPMPGIRVFNWRFAGSVMTGLIVIDTVTDEAGQFRLNGMPVGDGNAIMIVPPSDQPYFSQEAAIHVDAKFDPLPLNVDLHRGIWITGRVTDKVTGQPVSSVVDWSPYRTNEFAQKRTPEFDPSGKRTGWTNYRIAPDGTYRVIGLPGRALVAASVNMPHSQSYRMGMGLEKLDPVDRGGRLPGRMGPPGMLPIAVWRAGPGGMRMYHSLKEIDVPAGAESFTCDLEVDRGEALRVAVVDREGKAVSGFDVQGQRRRPASEKTRIQESSLEISSMGPGEKRVLFIHHVEKQLGKIAVVEFQPGGPREVKIALEPCSALAGRVVAPALDPKAGGKLLLIARLDRLDGRGGRMRMATCDLDKEGRFRFEGVLPGCEYILAYEGIVEPVGTPFEEYRAGPFTVQPGQTTNLGDVRLTTAMLAPANPDAPPSPPTVPKPSEKPTAKLSLDPTVDGVKKDARDAQSGKTRTPATPTTETEAPLSTEYSVLSPQSDVTYKFAGTVVDPDGKPAAKATISVSYIRKNLSAAGPPPGAVTDEHGKFEFSMKQSDVSDAVFGALSADAGLVAAKEGFGFAYGRLAYFETTGQLDRELNDQQRERIEALAGKKTDVLKLVRDDVPIRGRILNPEGQPVAGATVEAFSFEEGKEGTLDAWEAATKEPEASTSTTARFLRQIFRAHQVGFAFRGGMGSTPATRVTTQGNLFVGSRSPIVPVVRTDADGWFILKGVGRERIAELLISGPGIETSEQWVRTRTGEVVKLGLNKPAPSAPLTFTYYPNEFTLVSGMSIPVTGRVTDFKTGLPLAGVGVQSTSQWKGVVTDAEGKYRLEGLPQGNNELLITPPEGSRHLAGGVRVTTTAATRPLVRDISLAPGVLVRGRVIDETTGKPLRGRLEYFAYKTNSRAMESDSLRQGNTHTAFHPDAEGRFEIPVLPGPGILALRAGTEFPDGVGADAIDCAREGTGRNSIVFVTLPTWCNASAHNLLVPINPQPEDDELTVNLGLRRSGVDIPGRVLAPDGQPLANYRIFGANRHAVWPRNAGANFKIVGYNPSETRRLIIYHAERNLVGHHDLTGEPPKVLEITLRPAATLVGRVFDADGGAALEQVNITSRMDMAFLRGEPSSADLAYGVFQMDVKTDSNGRFELKGIVPGLKYTAHLNFFPPDLIEKRLKSSLQGPIFTDVTAEAGETKDLGDLQLKLDAGMPATPVKAAKATTKPSPEYSVLSTQSSSTSSSGQSASIVRGSILGPDGKPAAKAHVAVIGSRIQPERGGDLSSRSHVLAEGTTNDGGRFELKLSGVSSKTYSGAHVIARSDGCGLAWRRLDPDARDVDISFVLPAEQVIRGRFIDIEGQPAGGVRVSISSVTSRSSTGARNEGIESVGYQKSEMYPHAWPPVVTADPQGTFEIRGIPADHGVYLDVEGTDRIAPQWISINTGFPEERPKNDGTYRELVRNFKPGEEAVLPLAPAQIFEGVVRFEDTGEPAPHARLTIWASQQQLGGSMFSLAGKADARGRYRISPLPGVRFGITAYPPDGVPYLIRQIRDVTHRDGALVKRVDVSLPRGVIVRGRVIESGTKTPIAGAAGQYVPESRNNLSAADDIITGWQGIQLSGTDGAFEIAVLPGPGTLLANGPGKQFVSQEFGSRQLERGLPGGERNYAHAMQRVNPKPNSDPLDLTLALQRGVTISGRITNSADELVERALLISRLNIHPSELTWRGFPIETLGGRFELSGLGESREYPVHFLDPKNRLGATVIFKAGDQSPTVVLEPCGEAVAMFTDSRGKPIPDLQPDFEIVVTPGPHRLGPSAMRLVALAADAEYVANIDRTNYREIPKSDAEGRMTFPALIPGGRYRIVTYVKGRPNILKEFVAESGKTLELGKIVVAAQKEE